MNRSNLFLIGPMGAGKTTVGRHLARLRGMDFMDVDEEVERRTGVDIPFIFEKEGEAGFRRREAAVIAEHSGDQNLVLSTGGGAIVDPANRQHLAARGLVIYLHASVDQQVRRTRNCQRRPMLTGTDLRARLEELMNQREPLYRETADLVVCSSGRPPKATARLVDEKLREAGHP